LYHLRGALGVVGEAGNHGTGPDGDPGAATPLGLSAGPLTLYLGPGCSFTGMEQAHRIGDVARAAGVNVETLRYYERRGLLRPTRALNGYRSYDAAAARRVRFIRRAQALGFSLNEIDELLALRALITCHRRLLVVQTLGTRPA